MTDALAALRAGGKAAVARALTDLERAPDAPGVLALLDACFAAQSGVCVGLTGPPGVGKSTLTDAILRAERAAGRRVAVVAVDPSSSRTRGAVLGDRARLSLDPDDQGVFVRSMAARERLGGLAEAAYPATVILRAAYDLVLLETVGVGQSEAEIAEAADATAFCAQPSSGDALQYMKAGVLETPDVLLVTKADLGAPARRAAADARAALALGDRTPPPVLLVSATAPEAESGVAAALEALRGAALRGATAERREAQAAAWTTRRLRERFGSFGLARAADSRPDRAGSGRFAGHAATEAALEAAFASAFRP